MNFTTDYYSLAPLASRFHEVLDGAVGEKAAIAIEGLCLVVGLILLYAVLAIILIYMERRVCGAFQCRIGPNRVGGKGGLLQVPADVIKILTKEIIRLNNADHLLYELAPFFVIAGSFISFACLPWPRPEKENQQQNDRKRTENEREIGKHSVCEKMAG